MTYQLFGYNPICDTLQAWLSDFRARNHPLLSNTIDFHPQKKEKIDDQLLQLIPQFRDQKLFLPSRTIALMRQQAKIDLSEGRGEVAYQRFKRICEITADVPDDWRQLLNLARKIHRQVVPMLCNVILTQVNDPLFRFQTESLIEELKKEKLPIADSSSVAKVSAQDDEFVAHLVKSLFITESQTEQVTNDADLIPNITAIYSSQPPNFIDTLRRMAMKRCEARNYRDSAQMFKQICEMTKHYPSDWQCLIFVVKKINPDVANIISEEMKKYCRV